MSVDIAYIISHGFAARMVTQTNLLGLLVKDGKKVALICPDKNDENLKTYCESAGVILYEFNPESSFWTAQYADMRKYFLEDIDGNIALKEKHIWATRYNKSKNPISKLKPYLAYSVYKLISIFPIIRQWYKDREEKHLYSPFAEKLIQEIKPKVLVSTYPVSFTEAILLKAGNNHGNTKTIIHLLSWDNITCKGHFPQLADEYIAWGPIMKSEFIEYYKISEGKIHVCGVPHFDIHNYSRSNPEFKRYLIDFGLNPEDKYLFFGMSSPRFAPNEIDIVEKLAEFVTKDFFGSKVNLVIRPHPQNVSGYMADLSWLVRLEKIKSSRVAIDIPTLNESNLPWSMHINDMVRLSQLLNGAAIILNSGSTLSVDALCLKRPVILTSFDADVTQDFWKSAKRLISYPHLKKLVMLNAITIVFSFEELKSAILELVLDLNIKAKEREKAAFEFCYYLDGNSTKRVLNVLNNSTK
ncbi:MAG: hypothetical protein WAT92_20690 [Saprospiraceae bacterium]